MKGNFFISLFYFCVPFPIWAATPPLLNSGQLGNNILSYEDASEPFDLTYDGRSFFEVHDGRIGNLVTLDMLVYTTTFDDGTVVEYRVNPEFSQGSASSRVTLLATLIGQLPYGLRSTVDRVTVHDGYSGWQAGCGGTDGKNGIDAYMGSVPESVIEESGIEEALFHEACHTVECPYKNTESWQSAQNADGNYLSVRAQTYPGPEDFAETCLGAYAALIVPERITAEMLDIVWNTVPNRVNQFAEWGIFTESAFLINAGLSGAWFEPATSGQGIFFEVYPDRRQVFLGWYTFDTARPHGSVTSNLGDPGLRWVTALGPYENDTAVLTVYQTAGGVFDAENPAPVTHAQGDGVITLEFDSCTLGTMHYDIESIGRTGSVPIQRLGPDNVPLCESLSSMVD